MSTGLDPKAKIQFSHHARQRLRQRSAISPNVARSEIRGALRSGDYALARGSRRTTAWAINTTERTYIAELLGETLLVLTTFSETARLLERSGPPVRRGMVACPAR